MRKYLSEQREKLGLSQQDVANELGISRQYYAQIENGTRQKKMEISLVTNLSRVLHISIEKIVEYENQT